MKMKELNDLTTAELEQKLKEFGEKMLELRSQNVLGQLKNPLQIRLIKKDIARIKTIINSQK